MDDHYTSMDALFGLNRREFLRGLSASTVVAGGIVLGVPTARADDDEQEGERKPAPKPKVETNLDEFMKVPRAECAIPGPFPGKVVEVRNKAAIKEDESFDAEVIAAMIKRGICRLTGKNMAESYGLLFKKEDVIGLKVNPVGPKINTRLEVTEAVIKWLVDSGHPRGNIVIWDRFFYMLAQVGYTKENFPGVRIEAVQDVHMDREKGAPHKSEDLLDKEAYYYAKGVFGKNVRGYPNDEYYLNQHVYNNEYSYFGKLITKDLTKIVNLAAFKNTGSGISMATKNIGYGVTCNTGRLHAPLFFNVCTEVLAAPWVRDKLVLNITDGLLGQYDGGPGFNGKFVYPNHALYFATDPFALDMVCHNELIGKRKEMNVSTDEHPRYTDYLHKAEKLGLGIANMEKIQHIQVAT